MNTLALPLAPDTSPDEIRCTAFLGLRQIASGTLPDVVAKAKSALDQGAGDQLLIFDDSSSRQLEIDFRGTLDQVLERLDSKPKPEKRGPGRPKLGVIGREVTLLPRHWEWLDNQPGGASVALRRLVESAKKSGQGKDRAREAQEAVYRFMSAMAGDLPGYEEALRSFYAGNADRFQALVSDWPEGVRDHATRLAKAAFAFTKVE